MVLKTSTKSTNLKEKAMNGNKTKLNKIEKLTNQLQFDREKTNLYKPIYIPKDYVPQYNDKGVLLAPPIYGGLSVRTTPRK